MTWLFLILLGLALLAAFILVAARNRLVRLRHQVVNARGQIDVQLARRHDLIPNLVELVKGAMAHEHGLLTALVEARGDAMRALQGGGGSPESAEAEDRLTSKLAPLLSFVESQPHLMSLDNVRALQEELSSTENRIAFARQHYNDAATRHNEAGESFPASLFAGAADKSPLWTMPAGAERVPAVDLRFGAAAAG
ncbi:MAG TPA: LemA family protein [Allosphingosinicella sp.]|jgi:LemA protein